MFRTARERLFRGIEALTPSVQKNAILLDQQAEFPHEAFVALAELSLLTATIPELRGGLGLGYGAEGALGLLRLFVMLGPGKFADCAAF
jgi:alkylation response protein AidB-like acyl-CoA dehydrogenase